MTPHFFNQQKEKRKKRKSFKGRTIKSLSPRSKCYIFRYSRVCRIQKIVFLVKHGLWQFFSVLYASPLSPTFKKLISETNRTSCLEVFCKKSGLRNFAKFTGKHLTCARVSLLIKLQAEACSVISKETLSQLFSCEFCEFSKNTFSYRTPPVAASEGKLQVISFA